MHHGTQGMNAEMERCIQECLSCYSICTTTVSHCLGMGGEHASPQHITTLLDCAESCQTSANFMLRGSERHQLTCRVCADICRACAESCERMGKGDEMMRQCAEECRRCEQLCERMAA